MNRVSHVQFVEYLAEKLGIPEEEAAKKLTEFVLRIKTKSASGEIVIDGLGTFATENKSLVFHPEESFEIEINHTYAGMMPVEIDKPKAKTAQAATKQEKDKSKGGDGDGEGDGDGDKDKAEADDKTPDDKKEVKSSDFEEEEFVDVINNIDPFDFDEDTLGIENEEKVETRESSKETGKTPEHDDIDPFDMDSDDSEAEVEEAERVRYAALKAEEKRILEAAEAEEELEKQKQARAAAEAEAVVTKLESEKAEKKTAEEAQAKAKVKAEADAKAEADKLEKEKAESEAKAEAEKQKASAAAAKLLTEEREQADAEFRAGTTAEEELQVESGKAGITPSWVDTVDETPEKAAAGPLVTDSKDIHLSDRTRPASNTGMIAMALIAAVILIAAALYFFGFMPGAQPQTGPAETQQTVTQQTVTPPATEQPDNQTDATITEGRQLSEEEAEQAATAQPAPQPVDPPADAVQAAQATPAETNAAQANTHGLRGTINTSLQRPYTIIVHSLNSRSDAVREQEQIAQAGFRSTFYAVELPDGRTNWRVTIGQFADVESAVQASQQLPEPYLTNNFISRIEAYNP